MRRWVILCPVVVAAACLPAEKAPDGGIDGIGPEFDAGFDNGPPYTGDARNDIAISDLTASGDDAGAPPACPTATATGSQTVLIGWSYGAQGLIAMRADGSVVPVAPLGSPGIPVRDGGLQLWSTQPDFVPDANAMYEALLVDSAADVRWRFGRLLGPGETGTVLFLDGRTGAAALGFSVPRTVYPQTADEGVAIMPDGAVYELPGATPNGPPRPDGWVPWITTMGGVVGHQYGFINAQTGENQPLHLPVLGTSGAYVWNGMYVYRSWDDDGQATLVVDDPSGATSYPTPIGSVTDLDRRIGLLLTTAGALVTVDGRPRWLLRDVNDLVELGPLPGDVGGGTLSTMVGTGDWVLLTGGKMFGWSLQLSTGTFAAIPAFSAPEPVSSTTTSGFASRRLDDHWAMGSDGLGRIWRLDVATGVGGWLNLLPLRPFADGCGRQSPELLSDGTVAAGLRDDYAGGAYLRGPTDTEWRRVGVPMIGVAGVETLGVGSLLSVVGHATSTYCPQTPETWSPLPAGSDTPLRGDASEIVALPGPAPAFVNTGRTTGRITANPGNPTIQRSGGCGLWDDQVHNLATGETFSFPSTYAAWW